MFQIQLVMVLGDCRPGAGHGNASQENSSSWFAIVRPESNCRRSLESNSNARRRSPTVRTANLQPHQFRTIAKTIPDALWVTISTEQDAGIESLVDRATARAAPRDLSVCSQKWRKRPSVRLAGSVSAFAPMGTKSKADAAISSPTADRTHPLSCIKPAFARPWHSQQP